MTPVKKQKWYTEKDDILNKCDNTHHSTTKMKPVDWLLLTCIDFGIENNDKDPKCKVGDHVRIPKYKNMFAIVYVTNCSEWDFVIKKVKNNVPWTNVIEEFNGEETAWTFYEKRLQKTNYT